ncbi:hypothetical protein A2662_02470 [Candidatus Giovannonibacteria bacterium RIFCSPHIGHO2_01_FULL_45_33]|nr:MAG: hypothetical protein A2662_02470 [Candidatus Giovannonibacteria bacterium RIFCSPHIGHO2_01_FULL_45_33]OGF71044.1 MAG: hypothetical protein A3C73_00375 [Candidatus Giovannonibacteria bacterium RIFCSPHIGHO2_02_FULL_44_11]
MYEGMSRRGGHEEKDGKLSELFLLGRVKVNNPDYEKGIKKCTGKIGEAYWDCAIKVIKEFQPYDPINPQKRFPRDLRRVFVEEAGIKDEKKVKIFTMVDSVVDLGKKMDAFIEVDDEKPGMNLVSFNHKRVDNENDIDGYLGADVLIPIIPDPEEGLEDYENIIRQLGKSAAKVYLSRQQQQTSH